MITRLELTPNIQPPDVVKDVKKLDKLMFSGDERIKTKDYFIWVTRDKEGKAVAYGSMRPCQMPENKGLVLLTRAGVLPEYQGRGLQKRLIRARIKKATEMGYKECVVYCKWWNAASINALIACGFRVYQPASAYAGTHSVYLRREL